MGKINKCGDKISTYSTDFGKKVTKFVKTYCIFSLSCVIIFML